MAAGYRRDQGMKMVILLSSVSITVMLDLPPRCYAMEASQSRLGPAPGPSGCGGDVFSAIGLTVLRGGMGSGKRGQGGDNLTGAPTKVPKTARGTGKASRQSAHGSKKAGGKDSGQRRRGRDSLARAPHVKVVKAARVTGTQRRSSVHGTQDWYEKKASKADAKIKRWRQREVRDEGKVEIDSCEELEAQVRWSSKKLELHRANETAPRTNHKYYIEEKQLEQEVLKTGMRLGRKLERRHRFADACAAYSKVRDLTIRAGELVGRGSSIVRASRMRTKVRTDVARAVNAITKAIYRNSLKVAHLKTPEQRRLQKQLLRQREPITLAALEDKRAKAGELSDKEALWYSLLLNETVLGRPRQQKINPTTLRHDITRWIPPSLRRRTSASGGESFVRATHTPSKIAAVVARGAGGRCVCTSDRIPRMLMDGRAWAYGGRSGKGEGVGLACRFYLPEESWPATPCLVCFSWEHGTKLHGRGAEGVGVGEEGAEEEEEEEEKADEGGGEGRGGQGKRLQQVRVQVSGGGRRSLSMRAAAETAVSNGRRSKAKTTQRRAHEGSRPTMRGRMVGVGKGVGAKDAGAGRVRVRASARTRGRGGGAGSWGQQVRGSRARSGAKVGRRSVLRKGAGVGRGRERGGKRGVSKGVTDSKGRTVGGARGRKGGGGWEMVKMRGRGIVRGEREDKG